MHADRQTHRQTYSLEYFAFLPIAAMSTCDYFAPERGSKVLRYLYVYSGLELPEEVGG